MIANSLNHIKEDLEDIYDAIESKSGTIPAEKNLVNIADAVESIPAAPVESILPLRKDVILSGIAGETQMTDLQNALGKTLTLIGEGIIIICTSTTSTNKVKNFTGDMHIYEYGANKVNTYIGHGTAGTYTFATKNNNIYLLLSSDSSVSVSNSVTLNTGAGNAVNVKVYKMTNPTT